MGKRSKQGAALRARKRANVAHQQLAHALTEHGAEVRVQSKRDDDLFVLDTERRQTAASNQARRAAKAKDASQRQKREHSAREMRQIQKVLAVHGAEGAIALAARGQARLDDEKKLVNKLRKSAAKPTFDLWNEPPPAPAPSARKRKSAESGFAPPTRKQSKAREQARASGPPRLAVEVAHPGQSYRPDAEQHQEAIGEALSIEIRRNEAVEYRATPISDGMSALTKDVLVASDSEESSDDDDDDDGGDESDAAVSTKMIKRKEKLTRAQRNKQKRVKAEETSLKKRRQRKQFLHEANEVHVKKKIVQRAEKEQRQRQAEIASLKSEKRAQPLGKDVWSKLSAKDPINVPALPVALTEELRSAKGGGAGGGGLRTITPKGSLVTDRLESMVTRKMIVKKRSEGRRIVQGKRRPKTRGAQGTEYLLI